MKYSLIICLLFNTCFIKAQEMGIGLEENTSNNNGSYTSLNKALKNSEGVKRLEIKEGTVIDFLNQTDKFTKLEQLILHFGPEENLKYEYISKIKSLKELEIYYSHGTYLTPDMVSLPYLKKILISHSQLKTLPENIFQNKSLEVINFETNQLFDLPESINDSSNIKLLYLKFNNLKKLPDSLCKMENIEYLNISNNRFISFPNQISALKKLRILNVGFNDISSIPDNINALVNLETLYLTKTKITHLPPAFKQLKNLKTLYMSDKLLTKIEKNKIVKMLPVNCKIIWTEENYYDLLDLIYKNISERPNNKTNN